MTDSTTAKGRLPFLAGLFLICMCGLMLQLIETRILSVIAFYHLAFFAISMAMFGMTGGSLLVYSKSHLFTPDRLLGNLKWIAGAFALATVGSALMSTTTVVMSGLGPPVMVTLLWLKLILILLPPYFFAGMAISMSLTRSPWPVGLVYGVDLAGAATGCLVVLALLDRMDAVSALFAVGAIGAGASACFAAAQRTAREPSAELPAIARSRVLRRPLVLTAVLAVLAIGNAAIQPYGITLTSVKDHIELWPPAVLRWNSFSRIWVGYNDVGTPTLWGPSRQMPPTQWSERYLNIDGSAGTPMYRFDGDITKLDFLRYDVTNLAYALRNKGRAAVIGVGGGRDMLSAYLFGFRDVTGVELNPIFVDMLQRRFRSYNKLMDLAGVRLYVDEARSWFARTTDHFDLIQMSLIDTWASTGAGALSLSENGLYTVEGWHHFLNALTPNGVLTVSRWFNPEQVTETGRLLSLATAALLDRGVTNPRAHILLAASDRLATLVVSVSPFSPDDLARFRNRVSQLGFTLLMSPDQPAASPALERIVAARTAADFQALTREYHLELSPPTDDRPFFFNQLVLSDPGSYEMAIHAHGGVVKGNLLASVTIAVIVLLSAILVAAAIILPALSSVRQTHARLAWLGTLYFLLIGLGFMFIEIGLIQRASTFLGHPVYGLAIGLGGIILSTGIGSMLSEQWRIDTPPRAIAWSVTLFLYIVLMTIVFPAVVRMFEGHGLVVRALATLAVIVPAGMLMGYGFPTGMRLVNTLDTRPTPWFWAVNGAAGVLAASIAVGVSIALSINTSLWIGAACYLVLAPISVGLSRGSVQARSLLMEPVATP